MLSWWKNRESREEDGMTHSPSPTIELGQKSVCWTNDYQGFQTTGMEAVELPT